MRRWVLAAVFAAAGCSEAELSEALRDSPFHGSHRRAVFKLRRGAPTQLAALPSEAAFGSALGRVRTLAGERSGLVQPDLSLVRTAAIPSSWSDAQARVWAEDLEALHDEVDWVVLRLQPVPSPADLDPMTPSYVDAQAYAGPAGIGATGAHAMGLRGSGIRIHDVEYGWRASHEDLEDVDLHPEPGQTVAADALVQGLAPEHGTATVGMLAAPHNGYGIDGMVPDAELYTYPEWSAEDGLRRTQAVAAAVAAAEPGDVVLLQMQAQHPDTGQFGPAELDPDVWMLTRMASDAGIVVVAAAGNGALDLDGVDAQSYLSMGDSGAILVGAGDPDDRAPLPFSSHGRRVDLQGWGASVFTLGYGDFARLGNDDDQAYTDGFQGTSAALPMVASAAALLVEAMVEAERGAPDPADVRRLLASTGRPQADGNHIGPLPDLEEALGWVGARERGAPSVVIAQPESDAEVTVDLGAAHVVAVEVDVDDASPIHRVALEVDGVAWPTFDAAAPYRFDDVALPEGDHVLRVQAVDAWGNAAWSETRSVAVVVEDKLGGSSSGGTTSGDVGDSSDAGSGGAADASSTGASCACSPRERRSGWGPWSLMVLVVVCRRRSKGWHPGAAVERRSAPSGCRSA